MPVERWPWRQPQVPRSAPRTAPARAPQQNPAIAALGQKLFFDVRLSADGKISCASCHLPAQSFSDGRARSKGHEGREGTRNAPSLLNAAYSTTLFWDGRASDLEAQARAPLLNPTEHALPDAGITGQDRARNEPLCRRVRKGARRALRENHHRLGRASSRRLRANATRRRLAVRSLRIWSPIGTR